MQVGQFMYLKASTLYAETYDVPSIQGSVSGFNAGYVGKVTKLNVAGVGETQTFTEISDKYGAKQYFSNKDVDKFDFTDVGPDGVTTTGSTNTNGGTGGTTLDKIGSIFAGILAVFSKKTTTTPTTTTPTTTTPSTTNANAGNTDNTTGIAAWVKQNVVVVIIGAIVIVGGIIWAIVAAVKADKKDKEFQKQQWENKTNNQLRQFGMVE